MKSKDEVAKMAAYLNCNPDDKSRWPMEIINRLLYIKKHYDEKRFYTYIRRIISR